MRRSGDTSRGCYSSWISTEGSRDRGRRGHAGERVPVGDGHGTGRSLIRHRFDEISSFHFRVVTVVAVPDTYPYSHGFLSPSSPLSQLSRCSSPQTTSLCHDFWNPVEVETRVRWCPTLLGLGKRRRLALTVSDASPDPKLDTADFYHSTISPDSIPGGVGSRSNLTIQPFSARLNISGTPPVDSVLIDDHQHDVHECGRELCC